MRDPKASPPSPALGVGLELGRAALDLALLPPRALAYVARRRGLVAELKADLARETPVEEREPAPIPLDRPLRVFVACAEVSGETHAVNLLAALRAEIAAAGAPAPELLGLGGARLEAAGVALVGRPVERAAMGLDGMLDALPYYLGLLADAARAIGERRPDALVAVDSPALHVPLGRLARRAGVPVVHFVTPQYWGWAPWRARGYRSAVDRALSILPFEKPWYERRGIACQHVGHPLLDELPASVPPHDAPERRALALLPGSRAGVLARNLPWMLARVARLRERRPDLEVVLPHERGELESQIRTLLREANAESWVQLEVGDLHRSLARARAAFSVSGTVLIDLVHHRLPSVVVYRLANGRQAWLAQHVLTAPWFASPNLLAGREVCPEFCFAGDGPVGEIDAALERALSDPSWRRSVRLALEGVAARLGPPGACRRAARAVLAAAGERR